MPKFFINVSNMGQVWGDSESETEALAEFEAWKAETQATYGRAAGETVTLFKDAEIVAEWSDPFAGSFMQPHIEFGAYYLVETSAGTEIVPQDVCGKPETAHDLRDYLEGEPDDSQSFELRNGWLARMSAAGYTDCTGWTAHETEAEALAYLVEMYGNDN